MIVASSVACPPHRQQLTIEIADEGVRNPHRNIPKQVRKRQQKQSFKAKNSPPTSPSPKPLLQFSSSRHGYTMRRHGEAGPVLGVGRRRKVSHPGPRETRPSRDGGGDIELNPGRACGAHNSVRDLRMGAETSKFAVKTTEAGRPAAPLF